MICIQDANVMNVFQEHRVGVTTAIQVVGDPAIYPPTIWLLSLPGANPKTGTLNSGLGTPDLANPAGRSMGESATHPSG